MELMQPSAAKLSYRDFSWGKYSFLFRYDCTSLSKMWRDTNGTVAAVAGQTVARVDDQSGNGHNILNGTALFQPTATAVADGPGMSLDFATNDFLQPAALTATADDFVFMALIDNDATGDYVFDTETGRLLLSAQNTNGAYYDGAWRGTNIGSTSLQIIVWVLVAANSGAIYLDGVADQTGVAYTQRAIGGGVSVGARYDGTASWMDAGLRHFWGATRSNMTNAQINEIGGYLAPRHGLTWTDI